MHVYYEKVEIIVFRGKEWHNYEPKYTICEHDCSCIHLKNDLEDVAPESGKWARMLKHLMGAQAGFTCIWSSTIVEGRINSSFFINLQITNPITTDFLVIIIATIH
uniref:Uncharacterized protein n=1 Tax=Opuntia streptacantha TaxID=393608 RepID=A0A7C8YWH9_OPUST